MHQAKAYQKFPAVAVAVHAAVHECLEQVVVVLLEAAYALVRLLPLGFRFLRTPPSCGNCGGGIPNR